MGVAAALAAVVVLLPKVWDVVIDPAIGARSDRELTTRGSRHRLMTVGALTLPVGFVAMFAVPGGWSGAVAAVWVTVAFVLATTSFSLFQVPYIAAPADLAPFIAAKGSVALDGVSLTVNEAAGANFTVNIIPHTAGATTLESVAPGRRLNIEIDILARYLGRMMELRHTAG